MRVYLAAPWVNKDEAARCAGLLEDAGHEITEKWWEHKDIGAYPFPAEGQQLIDLQDQAWKDIEGVCSAEMMIVLQLGKSEGKAVEQGIAMMRYIPTVIVSPNKERGHLFQYLLPDNQFFLTIEDAIAAISEDEYASE